jgi:hypothetical protein
MVRIRPERFPRGTVHKLHHWFASPCKILSRLGPNAYHVELPPTLHISPIFNVEDLTLYTGHYEDNTIPDLMLSVPKFVKPQDEIEDILDDQIVSTRRGGYQKFLVHWKNRTPSDCCWLQTEEVQRLHPDLYDAYIARNSSESSSFPVGGN